MFWISTIAATSYLVLLVGKALLALREFARQQQLANDSGPSVTCCRVAVLQPILSGDPLLEEVLQGNAQELSERATLFWAVDENDIEGLRIAENLCPRYRHVELIRCPPAPAAENPKLFKLQWVLDRRCEGFEALVVLDDDTSLTAINLERALARVLPQLPERHSVDSSWNSSRSEFLPANGTPRTRRPCLFTGLPHYAPGGNLWSQLVASFVNNNSAMTYLPLLHFFSPISINGMFYAVPAQSFRDAGGFRPIAKWLCDDYAVKKHLSQQGWELEQGIVTATVRTHIRDRRHYVQLLHRWMVFARLLFADQSFGMQILLTCLLALPPFLLTLALATAGLNGVAWGWLLGVLVVRGWVIQRVQRGVFGQRLLHPGWSLLAETLQPLHVVHSLFQRSIQWRSHRIIAESADSFRIVG